MTMKVRKSELEIKKYKRDVKDACNFCTIPEDEGEIVTIDNKEFRVVEVVEVIGTSSAVRFCNTCFRAVQAWHTTNIRSGVQ